jgi:hypothetical protein
MAFSALDTFRKLGARAAARRAKRQLTALRGQTRRTRTLADPQQLSVREREVLTIWPPAVATPTSPPLCI